MKVKLFKNSEEKKLLVFYLGWGMDDTPFLPVFAKENRSVLFVYDYRVLEPPEIPENFCEIEIFAWSSGVFAALNFHEKVLCVAGTGAMYHQKYGILPPIFDATLSALKKAGEKTLLSFYANMFDNQKDFALFMKNRPRRTLSEIIEELEAIKEWEPKNDARDSKALITSFDRIIPPRNQRRFWQEQKAVLKEIPSGHFPFYRFSLGELIFRI